MACVITSTLDETRRVIAAARAKGSRVGLVPTMGALHEGHASLLRLARAETQWAAASIFVNPAQFGPHEDLSRYPRPFADDVRLCESVGIDHIFHPEPAVIYPPSFQTVVEVQNLQNVLEGASRPGHFRGVATVVLKLFNLVQPDIAYFGQKDAQQVRIIEQMVQDLNLPTVLKIGPTVRAADGLALSSRNVYLDSDQRQRAVVLFQALQAMRQAIDQGERRASPLLELGRRMIESTPGARLDYLQIVDWLTLAPATLLQGRVLIPLAVRFGATRLIDNILLDIDS